MYTNGLLVGMVYIVNDDFYHIAEKSYSFI